MGKESACNAGDLGSIPGLGRSPGEGKGYPLQYSGLENSMTYIVHGVEKSWTQLSDFTFTFRAGDGEMPARSRYESELILCSVVSTTLLGLEVDPKVLEQKP